MKNILNWLLGEDKVEEGLYNNNHHSFFNPPAKKAGEEDSLGVQVSATIVPQSYLDATKEDKDGHKWDPKAGSKNVTIV